MPHPRPSWPRRLRRVCVFLLLGLVTTVGVAWGFAISMRFDIPLRVQGRVPSGAAVTPGEGSAIRLVKLTALGATRFCAFPVLDFDGPHIGDSVIADPTDTPTGWAEPIVVPLVSASLRHQDPNRRPDYIYLEAFGWPFRSLWCSHDITVQSTSDRVTVHGGWVLVGPKPNRPPFAGTLPLALPLRPLWAGFISDTLFYGVCWWLLVFARVALPASRRTRRGHCPTCDYDLTGIDGVCPECGEPRA